MWSQIGLTRLKQQIHVHESNLIYQGGSGCKVAKRCLAAPTLTYIGAPIVALLQAFGRFSPSNNTANWTPTKQKREQLRTFYLQMKGSTGLDSSQLKRVRRIGQRNSRMKQRLAVGYDIRQLKHLDIARASLRQG